MTCSDGTLTIIDFCCFRHVTSDVTLTPSYKLSKFFALISAVLLRNLNYRQKDSGRKLSKFPQVHYLHHNLFLISIARV
jgi:hypothetical protein